MTVARKDQLRMLSEASTNFSPDLSLFVQTTTMLNTRIMGGRIIKKQISMYSVEKEKMNNTY